MLFSFVADRPPIFGAIPTARWLRQRRPIMRAADLNCGRENGLEERFQVLEDFKFGTNLDYQKKIEFNIHKRLK
jgi:hypothetical protein